MAAKTDSVGIVGLGHVGLSTAVCLAAKGITTVGVDADEVKVARIARSDPTFVEGGLPHLLSTALKSRKLRVTSDYKALADTGIQFITVSTPNSSDGSIDLKFVKSAVKSIGGVLRNFEAYMLVVVKSTVAPGTLGNTLRPILESASHKKLGDFGLASNPEFLREGHAIEDTLHPDRLVIGTADKKSERTLVSFYRRFYRRLPKTLRTTPVNAELVKYASNSFLATKVTFINEIANLCSALPGADVSVVAKGMGLDTRIAPQFLHAGLGYGGSCFPKDVQALLHVAKRARVELSVAAAAHRGNERQPLIAVELAKSLIGDLAGKRITLLGLAFKPDSDDLREATSLRLVSELEKRNAKVVAYDPVAMPNARRILGDRIGYRRSAKACLKGADCCVVVTEWPEFSKLRPEDFRRAMRTPAVVDGRRVLEPKLFIGTGVKFRAAGLGP